MKTILPLLAACVLAHPLQAAEPSWSQPPFKLKVGGIDLDTADERLGGYIPKQSWDPGDKFGHAAPYLADLDGDGRRDLVVGSFAGRFRYYRNIGTDAAPQFAKEFAWLQAGAEPARVRIYCCVASGPQMVDIDGDGVVDLTSGSYDPGMMYWFKGLGGGRFESRQALTDGYGVPLFAVTGPFDPTAMTGRAAAFMSNIAWADWDADGRLDLLSGNAAGELFVYTNGGTDTSGYTPTLTQPGFSSGKQIVIDGKKAVEEYHAAPGVADWDGDGLWDILVGTHSGAVYWLRNTGKPGAPEFKTREQLIGPGEGVEQWVARGETPRRGIRSQIHVVDYNRDGRLDILVGDWSYTMTPRAGLTRAQSKELDAARAELAAMDASVGFDFTNWRHKWPAYYEGNPALLKRTDDTMKKITPYAELYERKGENGARHDLAMKAHGHVWVFLRKPAPATASQRGR